MEELTRTTRIIVDKHGRKLLTEKSFKNYLKDYATADFPPAVFQIIDTIVNKNIVSELIRCNEKNISLYIDKSVLVLYNKGYDKELSKDILYSLAIGSGVITKIVSEPFSQRQEIGEELGSNGDNENHKQASYEYENSTYSISQLEQKKNLAEQELELIRRNLTDLKNNKEESFENAGGDNTEANQKDIESNKTRWAKWIIRPILAIFVVAQFWGLFSSHYKYMWFVYAIVLIYLSLMGFTILKTNRYTVILVSVLLLPVLYIQKEYAIKVSCEDYYYYGLDYLINKKDTVEAMKYFQKASEAGYSPAKEKIKLLKNSI